MGQSGVTDSWICCSLPQKEENIATKDEEKAEVLNAFFASVFNSQTSYLQGIQLPELQGRYGEWNKPPLSMKKQFVTC